MTLCSVLGAWPGRSAASREGLGPPVDKRAVAVGPGGRKIVLRALKTAGGGHRVTAPSGVKKEHEGGDTQQVGATG